MSETSAAPAGPVSPAARGVPVLHAITTADIVSSKSFAERARAVMAAGRQRVAVHLRTNALPTRSLFILAELLAESQRPTGAWVVVNDRLDVALTSGVRGVQLPEQSFVVGDARRLAGRRLRVGASVHDTAAAAQAARQGADWLLAGHVYGTPSHGDQPGRGEGFVTDVTHAAGLDGPPVIAVGGVTPSRVGNVVRAGAAGVAAIRGIWAADDPSAAVAEYLSAYDSTVGAGVGPESHGQR